MRLKIFICCLFIGVTSAKSQEFNGGVKAGTIVSQLDGDKYEGYNKIGLIAGVYVNRFLSKKLSAQFSLMYSEKGSHEVSDVINYKCKLQYVELPLTLRYYHYKKVDFEAGFSLAYLIKQSENINGDIIDEPVDFNKFDLSGLAGINYRFTEKLGVGIMFQYSVLVVRPFSENINTMDKGQHNNSISFTLAYQLSTWK